jgi:hypothetical protein
MAVGEDAAEEVLAGLGGRVGAAPVGGQLAGDSRFQKRLTVGFHPCPRLRQRPLPVLDVGEQGVEAIDNPTLVIDCWGDRDELRANISVQDSRRTIPTLK